MKPMSTPLMRFVLYFLSNISLILSALVLYARSVSKSPVTLHALLDKGIIRSADRAQVTGLTCARGDMSRLHWHRADQSVPSVRY
jgi:hypothetical protein